jgi:hypothetical protein
LTAQTDAFGLRGYGLVQKSHPDDMNASSVDGLAAYLATQIGVSNESRDYLREQTALTREQLDLTKLQKLGLNKQNAFELSDPHWRRMSEHLSGVAVTARAGAQNLPPTFTGQEADLTSWRNNSSALCARSALRQRRKEPDAHG